jgi:hypothetical protein
MVLLKNKTTNQLLDIFDNVMGELAKKLKDKHYSNELKLVIMELGTRKFSTKQEKKFATLFYKYYDAIPKKSKK